MGHKIIRGSDTGQNCIALISVPLLLMGRHRDVEELMAARGVILTYEAVRYWYREFGQTYANQ